MVHRPSSRLLLITGLVLFFILTLTFIRQSPPLSPAARAPGHVDRTLPNVDISEKTLEGGVVMPKLGNETAKAELGRASWKLLHTMMARFPDTPSEEEQETLRSYIYLFARLYPCGECASHFKEHLKKFPPQVSSRSSAAGWACHVHNEVNKMLHKEIFDCSKIGDFYDCGCADDEEEGAKKKEKEGKGKGEESEKGKDSHKPEVGDDSKSKLKDQGVRTPVKINAEPQTEG